MQILNAEQIRAWDQFTIAHEPVASIELMERAAAACVHWIEQQNWKQKHFKIFCGKGNNGGDGLAIARLLKQKNYSVFVYIPETNKPGSKDFEQNLRRLYDLSFPEISFLNDVAAFPVIDAEDIVVDALFGSGLNKPLAGLTAALIDHINADAHTVVSIDLPSGLFMDQSSITQSVVKAHYTLSFQCYKTGLLVQEHAPFTGQVEILDIGLDPAYLQTIEPQAATIDIDLVRSIYKPRNRFAHKGSFGHALLLAGSYGKMGAAILAARACIRSGAGLTTAFVPACGNDMLQVAVPEAMTIADANSHPQVISVLPTDIEKYAALGLGPGIGTSEETQQVISFVVRRYEKPLVIDADGLNCLSLQKELLKQLPPHSILTPHPKEFERLFGAHANDFERIQTAADKAAQLNMIIILKGHHSLIVLPDGRRFFNTTGNAGMAKGGSGDVLTGILTALLAQGYSPADAAVLGVYLHGLAGDLAATNLSEEAMAATDLIEYIADAFKCINRAIKS